MIRPSASSLRYIYALLIALLLLVQAGLIAHEAEHAVIGDNEQCVSCWLADHQYSYMTSSINLALPHFTDAIIESANFIIFSEYFSHYTPRAPPSSSFS